MSDVDLSAAAEEYSQLVNGEVPAKNEQSQQEEVPMFEIPYQDQVYKLPLTHEIPIKHNGQVVKAPLEKVLNAFRERSHLDDKFKQFNTQKEQFDQERQKFGEFQELHNKYGEIQKWSEENPEKWNALWDLYQKRDTALLGAEQGNEGAVSPQVQQLLENMQEQIRVLSQDRDARIQSEEERAIQEDVKAVEAEIANFRDTFGKKYGINLDEADENGITLQSRILQFGLDKGYQDFETAATMFLRDTLLDTAQQVARNEAVKSVQQQRKSGILSRSDTPFSGETSIDPTKLSEEKRDQMALEEFKRLLSEG